jgi:hypothetical protein
MSAIAVAQDRRHRVEGPAFSIFTPTKGTAWDLLLDFHTNQRCAHLHLSGNMDTPKND